MRAIALTLRQPYATLICLGLKQIETRRWATYHRGPLLIHAAKSEPEIIPDFQPLNDWIERHRKTPAWPTPRDPPADSRKCLAASAFLQPAKLQTKSTLRQLSPDRIPAQANRRAAVACSVGEDQCRYMTGRG